MLHLGRRRGVRPGALAGLIGIDATLHAPPDGGSQAGHGGECVTDDEGEELRYPVKVKDDDGAGGDDIAEGHERHDDLREPRDPLHAAEDDQPEDRDHGNGGDDLGAADLAERRLQDLTRPQGHLDGLADAVGLDTG